MLHQRLPYGVSREHEPQTWGHLKHVHSAATAILCAIPGREVQC